MIEINGKRNTAVVFADNLDKEAKTRLSAILREAAYADERIRVMPDVHASGHSIVGLTMTLSSGRICPFLLGVDIGCGVEVVRLKETAIDLCALDERIHRCIPAGAKVREAVLKDTDIPAGWLGGTSLADISSLPSRLYGASGVDVSRAARSLGTLGGGNHFIELDADRDGTLYLVIHSGSRQLGADVANYWQDTAYRQQVKKLRRAERSSRAPRPDRSASAARNISARTLADEWADTDIHPAERTKAVRREAKEKLPVTHDSAILEGELFGQYLEDVDTVCRFADANRRLIAGVICKELGLTAVERFSCIHNYIEPERRILRKGAISARQGKRVIIPLNMRDGAILGTGIGNPEWNFSAPHGAGRVCSRSDARYAYSVGQFQSVMREAGVFTTTATDGSLDECPMAYKPSARIIEAVQETVEIDTVIHPVYNFKAD